MKKLIFVFWSIILLSLQVSAQKGCGYTPDAAYLKVCKDPNSLMNQRINFLSKYSVQEMNQIKELQLINGQFKVLNSNTSSDAEAEENPFENGRVVPIVAHIVRRSNKTGGATKAQLDAAMVIVNNFYAASGFRFVVCQIRYINSDTKFNTTFNNVSDNNGTSTASYSVLDVQSNNVARKINMYFVPTSNTSWAWSPLSNKNKQHILMWNNHLTNGTTMSHEIGHWFNLLHTHGSTSGSDELVNGSNCGTAGDFVCDTPADPNLSGKVNSSCTYTGTDTDANDQAYTPDPRNLLSYAGSCRNRFSAGQITRMQAAFLSMNADRGYTLNPCGTIGDRIVDTKWTPGWNVTETFTIGSKNYLFLMKESGYSSSDKNVHIHEITSSGKVGASVAKYKWTQGWTTAEFFKVGSQNYLFLLREKGLSGSGKNVHIHKMNSNGTLGASVAKYKWTEGWTTAEFFKVGSQNFMFLLREKGVSGSGKNVHIHKMNTNGTLGSQVAQYKWTEGWTSAEFFKVGSQNFMFLLREKGLSGSGKNVHIHKINSNGTVGAQVAKYKWTEGWTTAEMYSIGTQNYLFLLKAGTGDAHLHKMNNDGKVGEWLSDLKWTPNWTNAQFYKTNNTSYLFLLKASTGDVHIHKNDVN